MESNSPSRRPVSRIVFLSALVFLSIHSGRPEARVPGAEIPVLARVVSRGGLDRIRLPVYASWLGPDESTHALVIAPRSRLEASGVNFRILDAPADPEDYVLATRSRRSIRGRGRPDLPSSLRVLFQDSRRIVARASEDEAEALALAGFEIGRFPEAPFVFRAGPEPSAAAPLSIVPDPLVRQMMDEATSTKAWTYDGNLSGEWPVTITGTDYTIATRHTRSGTPIAQATQYVYEFLRGRGLSAAFQNWTRGSTSGRNVSGTKVGSTLPNEIVLLTAHLDDMPSSGSAPGADDNASGCAALLTAAEIMSGRRFQRTVRFVFFTGEEQGYYGSAAYASAASAAGDNIVAVLNLDMIAWDRIGGPVANLYLRPSADPGYAADLRIAETFTGVVSAYGLSAEISPKLIADGSGGSDHVSFWSKGIPAILLIEDDWNDFNSAYHTSNDRLAALNTDFFAGLTKAAVGTVAHLAGPENPTRIALSRTSLAFGAIVGGPATPGQSAVIGSLDGGPLAWTASSNRSWLAVSPASGSGTGTVVVGVDPSGLSGGVYTGTVEISESGGSGSAALIGVTLTVVNGGGQPPFGFLDSPKDGSSASGSIAVTGWALDDLEVAEVKIYRDPVGNEFTQPNGWVYIGNAVFVEGARPDVETAYPGYPLNFRGGWGYMLLTNFFPNGGNGTFILHAVATDREGHQVELAQKTIIGDNRNAVKPFGAIDTPTQGGTASGAAFVNFGWALTPRPKSIPVDGSTITVWVDGLPLGHPVYDNFRADIAGLFPGFANSNGAVGYYHLNTTGYENKIHAIAWSVADSDGAVDGIGSRFFQILNAGSGGLSGTAGGAGAANAPPMGILGGTANLQSTAGAGSLDEIRRLDSDTASPVYVRRGYGFDRPPATAYPSREGGVVISIAERERVTIYLEAAEAGETEARLEGRGRALRAASAARRGKSGPESAGRGPLPPSEFSSPGSRYSAFLLVGAELRPLPIGATFDAARGVLYWQPGPGFLGDFDFVFVAADRSVKKFVKIRLGSNACS